MYPSRVTDFVYVFVSSCFSGCRVGECGFLAAVYRSRQGQAARGDVRDPRGQGLCCFVWPSGCGSSASNSDFEQ